MVLGRRAGAGRVTDQRGDGDVGCPLAFGRVKLTAASAASTSATLPEIDRHAGGGVCSWRRREVVSANRPAGAEDQRGGDGVRRRRHRRRRCHRGDRAGPFGVGDGVVELLSLAGGRGVGCGGRRGDGEAAENSVRSDRWYQPR